MAPPEGRYKALNLYAGVGGNRALWPDTVDVVAVEEDPAIVAAYRHNFGQDTIIGGDAHQYLLDNIGGGWGLIWSSPPCQSHSRMGASGQNRRRKRYADMALYQEILFLQTWSKRLGFDYVVENVVPYYKPLVEGQKVGRHLLWTSLDLSGIVPVEQPPGFIKDYCTVPGSKKLQDWLGLHYPKNIYYGTNHDPSQVWRNCVHPHLGRDIGARAWGEAHQHAS